jgi:hypothetical protein
VAADEVRGTPTLFVGAVVQPAACDAADLLEALKR